MNEPKWLNRKDVEELQAIVTERDGALAGGLVKPDLLESALARAQNEFAYAGEQDIFQLAAIYAQGIAQNHALTLAPQLNFNGKCQANTIFALLTN